MNFGYVNFGYDLRFGYDLVTKVRNLVTFWLRCLEFGYDLVMQCFGLRAQPVISKIRSLN